MQSALASVITYTPHDMTLTRMISATLGCGAGKLAHKIRRRRCALVYGKRNRLYFWTRIPVACVGMHCFGTPPARRRRLPRSRAARLQPGRARS